jgi:hypothetical protein
MKIKCPICSAIFDAPDSYMFREIKCPKCNKPFKALDRTIIEGPTDIVKNKDAATENAPVYKTISDFPETGIAEIFYFLGVITIILGGICLLIGLCQIFSEKENLRYWGGILLFSGIGTIISSIWFFGASAIICAVSRNTLEIHLFRKQQNKNDVEK